jgi:hypothetical protein
MSRVLIFCATVIATVVSKPALSQEWDSGELESIEIEIINQRQITIPKANRNFEKIPPRPTETVKSPVQYNFRPFSFQTQQINPAIRPLRVKQEDGSKVSGGYLSAGYGNYASPYLEGFINTRKNKNKLLGARGLFSSSDKGPVDGTNSGSGLTMASVFANSFNDQVSLSGDLSFENRTTHFYGYPEGTSVEAKEIKQSYSTFKAKGELGNSRNTDFSYKLGAVLSYLTDKFEARETEADFEFSSKYKIQDETGIAVSAGYYLINRKDELIDGSARSLFTVNPRYEFTPIENLKLRIGLNAGFENDSIDSKDVHLYPDFHASYPVTPSVELVASLTGGLEKVSLQSLSNENIWIGPNVPVFHTNKLYDLQAALHTKIGTKVSINGGFSIASLKNWYFFVNDDADQSRFNIDYDRGETVRSNFFASIGFAQAESANFLLRGDLYNYSTDEIKEAWHRPTYKVSADASFNIAKKILFDVNLIAQGGARAWEPVSDTVVDLDPAFDLNVRTEYMLSDKFSVFAQFNNLMSNNYPLFLNYPVRGFQVVGGLTWTF